MNRTFEVRVPRAALVLAVLGQLAVQSPVRADWPVSGRGVATSAGDQLFPAIATDGVGGAIVVWEDQRGPAVNLFAQHVVASGELDPAWPTAGRALLTDPAGLGPGAQQASAVIVPDGAGGAIVAWQDIRGTATGTKIFAQHVLASGVVDPAWPANGRALVAIESLQQNHVMIPDGAGGAIVAWSDSRFGLSSTHIFAQHVLASGSVDPRWPVDGLAVVTAPGLQDFPEIVSDGAGGAFVSWDDQRDLASGFDVYAQHVLDSGLVDPAWPANGRAVCIAPGNQGRGTITTDGGSGAILTWSDGRVVGTFHIFAHHLLASGIVDPAWPVTGRAISNAAPLESRPLVVPDGVGGAVVTWQAVIDGHLNQFAQHVTSAGVVDPAWPAAGRALGRTARDQDLAQIAPDASGGAIVAWEEGDAIVAQHVLSSGILDRGYPDTGLVLCNLPGSRGNVSLVATGVDGAVATWQDSRPGGNGFDIFALQVAAAGTLGVTGTTPPDLAFTRSGPNPARTSLTLRFATPRDGNVRLSIYDTSGRRVRELLAGVQAAGEHAIRWDLRDERGDLTGVGVYFARLEVDGHTFTQSFTRLK